MPEKKWKENLVLYDALVARQTAFKRKGKTMPYTSANGYMFSLLNKEGELGIRLPRAAAEQFMEKHQSTRYKSHGAFLKDYVLVPEKLLKDQDLLLAYLQEAHRFVLSLPPK